MDLVRGIPSSSDPIDCRMVAHDLWPRRLLERREELPVTAPQRVWWPEDDEQLSRIVKAARVERRALVPFGAGSGVCGGVSPSSTSWVIDTKRLSRIVAIDHERRTVVVEAGVLGDRLERALNARGLTLGHFPSSIYCSTVGGWVATRSAGQLSSRYGKIEDMVLAVEGVDGRGEAIRAAVDDPRTGPAAVQLLVGSEGALCIITRVTLRVHPLATHRWLRGFAFDDVTHGLQCMRALLLSGEAPSVLRLYDPLDSALAGTLPRAEHEPDRIVAGGIARAGLEDSGPGASSHDEPGLFEALVARVEELALFARPRATRAVVGELLGRPALANTLLDRFEGRADGRPRLVLGLEGEAADLEARIASVRRSLSSSGARDLGDAPGSRWLAHRHRVGYRMSHAFAAGGWVDTCEVACGWDGVVPLYKAVREALRDVAVVMCHFSHAYVDGCSLYFTLAGGGGAGSGPRSALSRYDLAWERLLATARRHGAVIAHHHGLGRSKLRAHKWPVGARALLDALKAQLDPDRVLNPGALGLGVDGPAGPGRV